METNETTSVIPSYEAMIEIGRYPRSLKIVLGKSSTSDFVLAISNTSTGKTIFQVQTQQLKLQPAISLTIRILLLISRKTKEEKLTFLTTKDIQKIHHALRTSQYINTGDILA